MPPIDAVRLPAPKQAPASTSSGNNPRGVAIAPAPKPTVNDKVAVKQAIATATRGTPRGTAIPAAPLPKTVNDIQATKPKPTTTKGVTTHIGTKLGGASGLGPIAAIQSHPGVSLQSLLKAPAGVLGRLGTEFTQLPVTTLEGVTQLGGAGYKAITGNPAPLGHLLSSAVTHDPIVQAISQGSLKPLGQDPLGTLLDAAGAYGIVGHAAGAIARSGALGDAAKSAAALGGREPFLAAPGVPGSAVERAYSPNLLTSAFQKIMDKHPNVGVPAKAVVAKAERVIRKQVASGHTVEVGQRGADEASIVKGMAGAKQGLGKEEQNVTSIMAGFGVGPEKFPQLLDQMERSRPAVDPVKEEQRQANMQMLREAIAKHQAGQFNMPGATQATEVHSALRGPLEIQKQIEGMRADSEMQNRLDIARARLEPNVHYLKTSTVDPVLRSTFKDAKDASKTANENLKIATSERAASLGSHQGASATLAQISRKIPTNPATSNLVNHTIDLRKILDESAARMKPYHDARVAYYKEVAKNRAADLRAARKAMSAKENKLSGTVIEDPSRPPIPGKGPLAGMSVRKLTADDMAAIRQHDPATQSFVSMRNPDVAGAQSMQSTLGFPSDIFTPAETGGKAYTGEAILGGDFRPGWSAMTNSLIRDNRAVSAGREWRNFLDRWSIPNEEGITAHASRDEAAALGQRYKDRTGLDTALKTDSAGMIHVVPKAASDELVKQWARDQPKGLERLIVKGNRLFRKTVLPYSPKLPVMHQVENVTRVAGLEKGNLPRAIPDYLRGRAILNAAGPAERAQIQSLVTPGSLSRAGAGGEAEDLGKLAVDRSAPMQAIHQTGAALGELGTQIIRAQRAMEHAAQTTALGAHARQLLQENGHSWLDANTNVTQYVSELRAGLATPATAERAAASMHKWLGQYNAFTGTERAMLRAAPFASWYMNAARLVFITLPRDHPLFSALVHDVATANQKQWDAQHAGLPEDLQAAAKVGPNAWLDVGKFGPTEQDPLTLAGLGKNASSLILPWATGPAKAAAGLDPFLNTQFAKGGIAGPHAGKAGLEAVEQVLEQFGGPLNNVARMVYGHGGTFTPDSTPDLKLLTGGLAHTAVKAGSTTQQRGPLNLPAAIDRVLDPFHPTTFGSAAVVPMPVHPGAVTPYNGSITSGGAGGISPSNLSIKP